jgi:NitT/TauT family transport system substrate-binding protein
MSSHKRAFTFISKKSAVAGMVVIVLVVSLAGAYFWWRNRPSPSPYAGPAEKLSIGTTTFLSTLFWVAEQEGFFRKYGVDVTINLYSAGLFAFKDLLAGKVQVAACAEFVLATQILAGTENARGLGIIARGHNHRIIARRDRGIAKPEDLQGKKIGVTKNTSGEYFLNLFLIFHGLSGEQVHIVDLKPEEMAEALSRGQVDAVMTWGEFTFNIGRQMGEHVVIWPGQVYQTFPWMLVTTTQFIQAKPEVLTRMFQALAQAEDFVKKDPAAAKDITARRIDLPMDYVNHFWTTEEYELKMDQHVLMAMEDEGRWAIRQNFPGKKELPNYIDYLYLAPLAAAQPGAVSLMTWEKKPNQ